VCVWVGGGGGGGGMHRPIARAVTTLDVRTRHMQNIKYKPADQPAKKCVTPYRIHSLPLLNAVVGNNSFSKLYAHAGCFVRCCRGRYIIEVLILWSWQRRFLRLCIHNI
jgi:hypothetical protein